MGQRTVRVCKQQQLMSINDFVVFDQTFTVHCSLTIHSEWELWVQYSQWTLDPSIMLLTASYYTGGRCLALAAPGPGAGPWARTRRVGVADWVLSVRLSRWGCLTPLFCRDLFIYEGVAIAVRTARCCCRLRYVPKFTAALRRLPCDSTALVVICYLVADGLCIDLLYTLHKIRNSNNPSPGFTRLFFRCVFLTGLMPSSRYSFVFVCSLFYIWAINIGGLRISVKTVKSWLWNRWIY